MLSLREIEERGFTKDRPIRCKPGRIICSSCNKDIAKRSISKHQKSLTCRKLGKGSTFSRNKIQPDKVRDVPLSRKIPFETKEGKREDVKEEREEDKKTLNLIKENKFLIDRISNHGIAGKQLDRIIKHFKKHPNDEKLNQRLNDLITNREEIIKFPERKRKFS